MIRRLTALALIFSLLIAPHVARAASLLASLNIQVGDLPPGTAVVYSVATTGGKVDVQDRRLGIVAEDNNLFLVPIIPAATTGSTWVLAAVSMFHSAPAAHDGYTTAAHALTGSFDPGDAYLPSAGIGDEAVAAKGSSEDTFDGPKHRAPSSMVLFRRGVYVMALYLMNPAASFPAEGVLRLARLADTRLQHPRHAAAPASQVIPIRGPNTTGVRLRERRLSAVVMLAILSATFADRCRCSQYGRSIALSADGKAAVVGGWR